MTENKLQSFNPNSWIEYTNENTEIRFNNNKGWSVLFVRWLQRNLRATDKRGEVMKIWEFG